MADLVVMTNKNEYYWVKYIHQRIRHNKNFLGIITGPTGCQPKDSKVLMANGSWKNIQDIKVGDEILSPQRNGSYIYSKVLNTSKWFCEENYNISELNHTHKKLYTCSYNHLIPVHYHYIPRVKGVRHSKNYTWRIKNYSAKELNQTSDKMNSHQRIAFSSPCIKNFKDRQNCKIEPYTLGIILGDGMFSHYKKTKMNKDYNKMKRSDKKLWHQKTYGRLSIESSDFEIIEEVSKHYPIINIIIYKEKKSKSYEFSLNSILARQLKKYGLVNKKSGTKFIPKEALLSDLEYRKKLLAGLIDTDGYYKSGGYSIVTKSKLLSRDILDLVYSLGGRGNIRKIKKKIKSTGFEGEYYQVSFYLCDLVLPLKLKRKKKDISSVYLASNRIAIKSKKGQASYVYGFEIDSRSQWYVTDNWMVTHNSGKSYSGLTILKLCDDTFGIDRVVFKAKDLLNLINIINSEEFKKRIGKKKGIAILWDESGVEQSNRSWQSMSNRVINYLLQTFRHQNFILLFTAPYSDFIDKQTRKLFHAELRTISINHNEKTVKLKPYLIQYNSRSQKFYYKFLRVATGKGVAPLTEWRVPIPDEKLRVEYEEAKNKFTTQLNKEIQESLEEPEKDNGKEKPSTRLRESDEKRLVIKVLKHNYGLNNKQLAELTGTTVRNIQKLCKNL